MEHSQRFDFQTTNEEGLAYHFSTHGCAMDLKAMRSNNVPVQCYYESRSKFKKMVISINYLHIVGLNCREKHGILLQML